jgi:hypothetical protein
MAKTAGNDHIDYEQKAPHHEREDEFIDRARERLDQALRGITEAEERLSKNLGQGLDGKRKSSS